MGAFLGKLLRFVLAVVLAPLVAAFTVTAFEYLTQNAQDWLQSSFTIGFVASLPIWILFGGNRQLLYSVP